MKNLKLFEEWKIPKWLISAKNIKAMCDNCEYGEIIDVSDMAEREADNLINKKCPRCGHTMLNHNDIKKLKFLIKRINIDPEQREGGFSYRTKKH